MSCVSEDVPTQIFDELILAGSSCALLFQLTDDLDAVLPKAQLTTLTLTLVNKRTRSVLNSVSDTDIKDTGRGSLTTNGLLTLSLTPADNAQVATNTPNEFTEDHIGIMEYTWASGAKAGAKQFQITITKRAA